MNRSLFIIFFITLFCSTNALAESNKSYERINLKYGISFEKPLGWENINNKKFRQLDNNTEAITGIGQADNEILSALNCYTGEKYASATFRISRRNKKSEVTQDELSKIKGDDFKDVLIDAISKSIESDKKLGTQTRIESINVCTVKMSGLYSLFTRKDTLYKGRVIRSGLFIIPISNAVIKIVYSYDVREENLLKPIIIKMVDSVKISDKDH